MTSRNSLRAAFAVAGVDAATRIAVVLSLLTSLTAPGRWVWRQPSGQRIVIPAPRSVNACGVAGMTRSFLLPSPPPNSCETRTAAGMTISAVIAVRATARRRRNRSARSLARSPRVGFPLPEG
jgi:hypothetical protein